MAIGGFGMMVKSLGIDPEEMKKDLTAFRDEVMMRVKNAEETSKRIEAKIDLLLESCTESPEDEAVRHEKFQQELHDVIKPLSLEV